MKQNLNKVNNLWEESLVEDKQDIPEKIESPSLPVIEEKKEEKEKNKISLSSMSENREKKMELKEKEHAEQEKILLEEENKDSQIEEHKEEFKVSNKKVEITLNENILKEEKTEESNIDNEESTNSETNIFSNYESDFISQESNIVKNLKKLKNLPKTRPILVAGLLGASIIIVSLFFILDPQKQNLNTYKARLLGIEEKKEKKEIATPIQVTPPDTTTWVAESIIHGWYSINFESKTNPSWTKIYKYKWKEYNNAKTFYKEVDIEVLSLKKSKVKSFLLPKKQKIIVDDKNEDKIKNAPSSLELLKRKKDK